jgi:hypothetical protein
MSAIPMAERTARGWAARCEVGNLGNRTTCPCLHCGVWRQREAARLLHEATIQARGRIRARARGSR